MKWIRSSKKKSVIQNTQNTVYLKIAIFLRQQLLSLDLPFCPVLLTTQKICSPLNSKEYYRFTRVYVCMYLNPDKIIVLETFVTFMNRIGRQTVAMKKNNKTTRN